MMDTKAWTIDLATARHEQLLEVLRLVQATWPKEGQTPEASAAQIMAKQATGQYQPGDHLWFACANNGKVIATAQSFIRPITVAGKPLRIIALAAVCTDVTCRNKGLGGQMVRAVFARVGMQDTSFCLYQTSRKNRPFYEHLGAGMISSRIVNSLATEPEKNPFWDEIAMYYPAAKPWPAGTIDLVGPGY